MSSVVELQLNIFSKKYLFSIFVYNFVQCLQNVAITSGVRDGDIVKLSITKAVPKLKFICFDIANGHMERFCDVIGEARKTFPQHTIMVFIFCITVI